MYLETKPSNPAITSATARWYAAITSRRSSGSRRAESAVEPTRSQNITVSCRRSASADAERALPMPAGTSGRSAAIASSNRRRCPTKPTPRSFRSSGVRLGNTLSSISLARNAGSYCSRPSFFSHSATSIADTRSIMRSTVNVPCFWRDSHSGRTLLRSMRRELVSAMVNRQGAGAALLSLQCKSGRRKNKKPFARAARRSAFFRADGVRGTRRGTDQDRL